MAIEAKSLFLRDLEQTLSNELTATDMSKVLSIVSDKLPRYDMNTISDQSNIDSDDLTKAYLTALEVGGRSRLTVERYRYIISRMKATIAVPIRDITVYHLRKYLSDEKTRGISDRTLEGIRQVFSAYFNWLQREGLIKTNPTANLGSIKYLKKQKNIYSDADIERMKCACKNARDKAIVCFLKATGCRISEVTQLNRDDVNFTTMECVVLGKGNKERVVYLDQIAILTLQEYLECRTDQSKALFVGKGSERLTPNGIRRMLTQLGMDAHVEHVHPHKFRRTLATNLIRHGMVIQEVSATLGHDKLDTTMQYVVLDKTAMKHSYCKYT